MAKSILLSDVLPQGMSADDGYVVIAALGAFVVVWSLGMAFVERDKLAPRLKAIQERREALKAEYLAPKKRQSTEAPPDWMRRLVQKLAVLKEHQLEAMRLRLAQAGYRSRDAVVFYAFAKVVMPIAGLVLGLLLSNIDWSDPFAVGSARHWLMLVGCAYLGAKLQDVLIANRRSKRFHAIRLALPDTLDLMLICAEAGLSLAATLDRVARELGQAYPEMAEELTLTSVEIGFLPERATALKHFMQRVDIGEVHGMVNVLLQTEKYGTPVSQALRVLSKEFRTERMLRAEQKAARLPALMTIPLIVFILPTLFVVIMTPSILSIMDGMK